MPLSKLFWFMILVTFAMVIVQTIGYQVVNYVILLLIIDVVVIEVSRELEKGRMSHEIKETLLKKIESISELSERIVHHLDSKPDFKSALETHKSEFKNDMDRLALRAVHIENDINRLIRTVGSALAIFDERIKKVESEAEIVVKENL